MSGRSASASCSSASSWAGTIAVGKGGAFGALIACWVSGLLYTCVAMIDSEVTSTVAAAGGQYAQAKHIIGPLMAFNVGLFLVMAYTMLEAGNVHGRRLAASRSARGRLGHDGSTGKPFIVLTILAILAWLNYRGVFATLTVNFVITAIAFVSHRHPVHRRAALGSGRGPAAQRLADRRCPMAGSASSPRCISASGSISASRAPARRPRRSARRRRSLPLGTMTRHDHAADRRRDDLVRLPAA